MNSDCHMHMVLDGVEWRSAIGRHQPRPDEAFIHKALARYQQRGITYLRDGGDRWGVGALELTTDEIIESLSDIDMPRDSRMALVAMLRTADMVKFAKMEPEAEENEQNYIRAYYFVENTKLVDEEQSEGKQEITIDTKIDE